MRFALSLATAFLAGPAVAQPLMPKFSYKWPGGDGYELVMVGPGDLPPEWVARVGTADAEIRKAYTRSGLYPVNNTTDPLWTTDEYWDYPTQPLPGLVHVVRIHGGYSSTLKAIRQDGRFPTDGRLPPDAERAGLDAPAITFYAHGRPIRMYTVRELVSDPDTVTHGPDRVIWCDGTMFYPESGRYTVDTTDGNRILFDPTTGEIIGRMKTRQWLARQAWTAGAVVAGVALPAGVGLIWWWRRRAARATGDSVSQATES